MINYNSTSKNSGKPKITEIEMYNSYHKHNITIERANCYKEFTLRLITHIHDTYFGNDFIFEDEDIRGHFNWCYNKTVDEFLDIGINFKENDTLYNYFIKHYYKYFYKVETQNKEVDIKIFTKIFDYKKIKSNFELDEFIKLYTIFNKSFIKN